MQYRAEVDGLRTIAVLPVILFHAGLEVFSGGFVGVDMFFVISGYLITSIILGEMSKGKFSLLSFYERRARRILPALFFVVLCCFPLAWYGLLPKQFVDFAESVIAVSVFASNFLFWTEAGYFDTAVELKPLLHTWSLAVEEQYYVFFPLLLMALWRFGIVTVVVTLTIVAMLSMASSLFLAEKYPSANFYLLFTRAWELLIGAFCAFFLRTNVQTPLMVKQILAAIGLVAIVISIFLFDEHTPFPGPAALLPTLGVAMIILFGTSQTWVAKLLSISGMVMIGQISYSAYLWHQPLIAFAKVRLLGELGYPIIFTIIVLTLILAYFSYRFVEQPFRKGGVSGKMLIAAIVGTLVVVNGAAAVVIYKKGFPSRLQAVYPAEANARELKLTRSVKNDSAKDGSSIDAELPVILIIGDSYVRRWTVGLSSVIDKSKYRIISISYLGCAVSKREDDWGYTVKIAKKVLYQRDCDIFGKHINDKVLMDKVEHVFLASHRAFEYVGNPFRFELLNTLLTELSKARLHIIGDYFQLKYPQNPSCLNVMFVKKSDASVCLDMAVYPPTDLDLSKQKFYDQLKVPYQYIDIIPLLCGDSRNNCPFEADGVPFMTDWNHATATFLKKYLPIIVKKNGDYLKEIGLGDVFKVQ